MINNIGGLLITLVSAVIAIMAIISFVKVVKHCYRSYDNSWIKIINPLHQVAFVPLVISLLGVEVISKYSVEMAEFFIHWKWLFILFSAVAALDRLIRRPDKVSVFTALLCLFLQIMFALGILVGTFAVFYILIFIGAILIACAIGGEPIQSSSGNREGWTWYVLKLGWRNEFVNVYSVNGNMQYLYDIDGNMYSKFEDFYIIDDIEERYYIYRRI